MVLCPFLSHDVYLRRDEHTCSHLLSLSSNMFQHTYANVSNVVAMCFGNLER
jgi:hypothetical protein